ncbi:MAG TPA: hypothetical protein VIW25_04420 [Nitrososphaeraceae archaeon]
MKLHAYIACELTKQKEKIARMGIMRMAAKLVIGSRGSKVQSLIRKLRI